MIPLMQEEMAVIRAAQQVRGMGRRKGIRGQLQNLRQLMLPLLVRSMREAGTLVHSMESRAFGAFPTRTFTDVNRMKTKGKAITLALLALVVVWYVLVGLNIIHTQYIQ
jgi:energy-coupling factor transport system permease protein